MYIAVSIEKRVPRARQTLPFLARSLLFLLFLSPRDLDNKSVE